MTAFKSALYYTKSIYTLLSSFSNPFQILSVFLSGGNTQPDGVRVRLKKSGLIFKIRNAMDVWSIKETFLDDFYHFDCSSRLEEGTILDIGAGIGEFAIQAAAACPKCRVIGFEPFHQSYEFFKENITINSLTNVTAVSAAVSSTPGRLVMDVSSGNPLQYRTQTGSSSENTVETVPLIGYLDAQSISSVDLLKLDCEGGEFDIVLPISDMDLHRIHRISMEYHDGLTGHDHHEIVEKLEKAGFSVETVPNIVHDNIGYIYAQQTR
jgi:FkbM family methyltransferase